MAGRKALTVAVLLIAACDRPDAPIAQNDSSAVNFAAPPAQDDKPAKSSAEAEQPATVTYTLAGDGLSPGLKFGMKQADAIAAAARAFGKPGPREHNDECGEGPMDFVRFKDLQLGFQEGKLAGWSLGGKTPALKTAGGVAIGTPRSALNGVEIDEQSSLGPEFSIDDVGGILGEGDKVEALWAGLACQFR